MERQGGGRGGNEAKGRGNPIHSDARVEGRKTPYTPTQTRPTALPDGDPNLPHVWVTLGGLKGPTKCRPSCHRDTLLSRPNPRLPSPRSPSIRARRPLARLASCFAPSTLAAAHCRGSRHPSAASRPLLRAESAARRRGSPESGRIKR